MNGNTRKISKLTNLKGALILFVIIIVVFLVE